MTSAAACAIAIGAALLAGWLVPALTMRGLAVSLSTSPLQATNYRGRRAFLGLGLVWVVWSVALLAASTAFDVVAGTVASSYGSAEMLLFDGPLTYPLYAVPIILTLGAVALGFADDVFGTHDDKGFRGHLRALASGRLSTGGLKLFGIGVLAAVYGWHAASRQAEAAGITATGTILGWWVAATLVIALSANFVNLMDLRPGRALKTYSVLASGAGILFVFRAIDSFLLSTGGSTDIWTSAHTAVTVGCMLIVLLGPVVAVWRFDLGERGMLGDAGSNAMGAIVGYLLAGSLSLLWLAATAVVLLGLNVLSERVSFGAVIDRTPPLRFLDRLGRLRDDGEVGTKESDTVT